MIPSWVRRPPVTAAGLLAIVFLFHLAIVATPGFFSHDEWQRADGVRDSGLQA